MCLTPYPKPEEPLSVGGVFYRHIPPKVIRIWEKGMEISTIV